MIRDLSRNLRARSILSHGQRIDPDTGEQITYVNTHKIHVTADEMILQNRRGEPHRATSVDVTIDLTALGVNGLDSGTKSPNTWYHIWIISSLKGAARGLFSESASNPKLPKGYPYKAYVGAVYNNQNDFINSYYQNNKLAWAERTCPLAGTSFSTNPTMVDLSASIPSTAISVILELSGLTTIGGHFISNIFVGPTSDGPWHNQWMMVAGTPQGAGSIDHVQFITQNEIFIDAAQQIYAYVGTTDDRIELRVLGWRY